MSGWGEAKANLQQVSPPIPSGCLLYPTPHPPLPDLNTQSSTKTKQTINKQRQTYSCHLRDFSQFSPGRRELAVSFSEATRTGPACNPYIPVVSHHPGSSWRSHSSDICMALRVRAPKRNDSPCHPIFMTFCHLVIPMPAPFLSSTFRWL